MTQTPVAFTAATPRHLLPLLFAGQAQKEFYVNEALSRIDMLLQPSVLGIMPTPPANPQEGDTYIVGAQATGVWAGHDGSLAGWSGSQWSFVAPMEGSKVYDRSIGQFRVFTQSWSQATTPSVPQEGSVIDSELRAAFGVMLEALREAGVFAAA